jgi:1,4-alpha-glucan branching enzyme
MPGDDWQRFATLRLLYGFQYGHPGKKLQFMGDEFGQRGEWNHDASLDWHLLDQPPHAGLQRWMRDLNRLYRTAPPLHTLDAAPAGFEWIDCNDHQRSLISFIRRGHDPGDVLLFACNFTPIPRLDERIGVPIGGFWRLVSNSDAREYGGSGVGSGEGAMAVQEAHHGRPHHIQITIPPLGVVVLRSTSGGGAA